LWNYVRKPVPPCPLCGRAMNRISQRKYRCNSCYLEATYRRGTRDHVLIWAVTDDADDWVHNSGVGLSVGKRRIFLREVVV